MGQGESGQGDSQDAGKGQNPNGPNWRCDARIAEANELQIQHHSGHGGGGGQVGLMAPVANYHHHYDDQSDIGDSVSQRSGHGGGGHGMPRGQRSDVGSSHGSLRHPASNGSDRPAEQLRQADQTRFMEDEKTKEAFLRQIKTGRYNGDDDHKRGPPQRGRHQASEEGSTRSGGYSEHATGGYDPHYDDTSAYSENYDTRGGGGTAPPKAPNRTSSKKSKRESHEEHSASGADEMDSARNNESGPTPMERDLERKLQIANQNLAARDEEILRCKEEVDDLKQDMRKEKAGKHQGNDLEHQAMKKLVDLRDHVIDIEEKMADMEKKSNQYQQDRDEAIEKADSMKENLQNAVTERQQHLDDIDNKQKEIDDLAKKKDEINNESKRLREGLHKISIERDETLELLEKAVKQKDQLKKGRNVDVEQARSELQNLQKQRKDDQKEVQHLLSSVDQVLARSEKYAESAGEGLQRELVKIRDGMRQLNLRMRGQTSNLDNAGGGGGGGGGDQEGGKLGKE